MKKIVYLHQTGEIGGAGLGLYYTAKMLKDKFDIVIYCPQYPSDMATFMENKGFNVKTYSVSPGYFNYYSGGPKLLSRSFFLSLYQVFKSKKYWEEIFLSEKADLIIVNSMVLCWMQKIIKKSGAKSVCYVRETLPKDVIVVRNKLMKHFLNRFDGVLYISEYDKKRIDVKRPVCEVIRDCVDISAFNTHKEQYSSKFEMNEKLKLLFVGGGDKIKGLDIAVKALSILKDFDIELTVAGYCNVVSVSGLSFFKKIITVRRNKYLNNIYKIININNLNDKIKFIGIQKDMYNAYSDCDILLFPSTSPHQARPVFEAGYFGKPAIVSDYPQTREHMIHEYNGLCFSPKNYIALANAIKQFYSDRHLINKYGENNFKLATKKHDYNYISNVLSHTIDAIVNLNFRNDV